MIMTIFKNFYYIKDPALIGAIKQDSSHFNAVQFIQNIAQSNDAYYTSQKLGKENIYNYYLTYKRFLILWGWQQNESSNQYVHQLKKTANRHIRNLILLQ